MRLYPALAGWALNAISTIPGREGQRRLASICSQILKHIRTQIHSHNPNSCSRPWFYMSVACWVSELRSRSQIPGFPNSRACISVSCEPMQCITTATERETFEMFLLLIKKNENPDVNFLHIRRPEEWFSPAAGPLKSRREFKTNKTKQTEILIQ